MNKYIAAAFTALALVGCKEVGFQEDITFESVEIIPDEVIVNINDTQPLSFEVKPEGYQYGTFKWSSDDPSIARVSKRGVITAVSEGSTEVKITLEEGFEAKCLVTVVIPIYPVESVAIEGAQSGAIVADQGSKISLKAIILPENASNKRVSWKSDDESLAKVDSEGNVEFGTGKEGEVHITVTTEDGGLSATQSFYVRRAEPMYIPVTERIIAGIKTCFHFNSAAYPDAADIKWIIEGKEFAGKDIEFAFDNGGQKTISVSAVIRGTLLTDPFTVNVDNYLYNVPLPREIHGSIWSKNSSPVFSPDCKTVYFVTLNARRLFAFDLENGVYRWNFDIMENNWAGNGGQFCVNPTNGNVIVSSNNSIYCISPEGAQLWKWTDEDAAANASIVLMKGCGPAISNGGETIFAHVSNRFIALRASDGALMDSFSLGGNGVQYVVYGNNDIALYLDKKVRFFRFADGKFSDRKYIDIDGSVGIFDITSGAVSADQKKIYFSGSTDRSFEIEVDKIDTEAHTGGIRYIGGRKNNCNSFCFLPDGKLVQTANLPLSGNPAGVLVTFPDDLSSTSVQIGSSNTLNFTHAASDTEGYFYFFQKGATQAFYRGSVQGSDINLVKLSEEAPDSQYQGAFNFAGGYLVSITGMPGTLHVRYVDAKRAKIWSGRGGDICCTNNANFKNINL